METFIIFVATGCFTGLLPVYPGGWGAALGLLLCFFCRNLSVRVYIPLVVSLFFLGLLCAELAEGIYAQLDAKPIVIDELFGIFLVLWVGVKARWEWFMGFTIFLVVDGLKPFPASWLDANMHGGLGIMLDDAVAGLYALLILQLMRTAVRQLQQKGRKT